MFSSTVNSPPATITIDDGTTKALPFCIVLAEDHVANIVTEIKAVADSGETYSHVIRRTVKGIAGNPPGAIVPVGTAQELGIPYTKGLTSFGIDFTMTNNTGHVHFKGEAGKTITITMQEQTY